MKQLESGPLVFSEIGTLVEGTEAVRGVLEVAKK
jgi:hypothetical protein